MTTDFFKNSTHKVTRILVLKAVDFTYSHYFLRNPLTQHERLSNALSRNKRWLIELEFTQLCPFGVIAFQGLITSRTVINDAGLRKTLSTYVLHIAQRP